jgi:transcriptional regulator GlxA family with amidase domain
MTTEEKKEMERLREEVDRLTKMNVSLAAASERLMTINNEIYKRLDSYYNVRMRVDWLKDLVRRHREMIANADLRDDDELLAVIEARIEGEEIPLPPDFGVKDVAELVGITQGRVTELYKKKTIYHSLDKYLDFLRLMRALRLLRDHPGYSIEAIAHEAGFATVRTLNRKIQDALGVTPGEFRVMSNPDN